MRISQLLTKKEVLTQEETEVQQQIDQIEQKKTLKLKLT
jgi:hypothetical protein